MTTTTVKAGLRVAILGGMVGLLPGVAWADSANPSSGGTASQYAPDHAAAEARGAGKDFTSSEANNETHNSSPAAISTAPDHATLEAGAAGTVNSSSATSTVTDHASAESRGAHPDQR